MEGKWTTKTKEKKIEKSEFGFCNYSVLKENYDMYLTKGNKRCIINTKGPDGKDGIIVIGVRKDKTGVYINSTVKELWQD